MVQQPYAVKKQTSMGKTILLAGLIAGTLDALFAIASFTISTHSNPIIVFWYIAGGLFKSEPPIKDLLVADGGTQFMYGAAGVMLHYFIAYTFVTFLFFVYPFLKRVLKNNIIIAIVYGCCVWLVMNYIVVPLAITGKPPQYTLKTILGVSYLIIAIGLIGSLLAGKYYAAKKQV